MKKISLLFIMSLFVFSSYAQIAGLSASKLATLCTTPVGAKTIEFEPFFSFNTNLKMWDDEHNLMSSAASGFDNSFGFRFTYGVSDNLETGFSVPIDASSLQWGAKYRIVNQNIFSFALISGANFDFHTDTALAEIGIGGVITLQYNKNISSDLDFHFINDLEQKDVINQVFVDLDNGIYIGDIQYILGLNYVYRELLNNDISNNFYLSPGVTIEPANNFLMVFAFPFSVYGTNDTKNFGFSFALTITID